VKIKLLSFLSLFLLLNKPVSTFSQDRTTTILERNEYDHAGRLLRVYHAINGAAETQIAEYTYNELGQQVAKNLHRKPDATFAQTLSQRYNERGWLTSLTANLFQMQLDYVQSSIPSYAPQYNGNISAITWTHLSEPGKAYRFSYDRLSRLANAESFSLPTPSTYTLDNAIREGNISYDANGNILTLLRNQAGIAADNLSYRYEGNRLRSVVDASTDNTENYFKDNGQPLINNDYGYDECGRLTSDANKGITSVTYNNNSLPIRIEKSATQFYQMVYDEAGTLRRKVVTNGAVVNTTDYVAGFQYENNTLDFIPQPEGFVKSNPDGTFTYMYAIRDHLGSTRVVVNQDGTLSQKNDYYPFGQEIYRVTGGAQWNYKYNGKENQIALGLNWNNYGARYYDAQLGRWHVVDPRTDELYSFTPYNYVLGNPIKLNDPDGKFPFLANLVGAVVGAGVEYGVQVVTNLAKDKSIKESFTNVDVADIAVAAGEGFLTAGASVGRRVAISIASEVIKNTVDVDTKGKAKVNSAESVVVNTAVGVVVGEAAKALPGKIVTKQAGEVAKEMVKGAREAGAVVTRAAREVLSTKAATRAATSAVAADGLSEGAKKIVVEPAVKSKTQVDDSQRKKQP